MWPGRAKPAAVLAAAEAAEEEAQARAEGTVRAHSGPGSARAPRWVATAAAADGPSRRDPSAIAARPRCAAHWEHQVQAQAPADPRCRPCPAYCGRECRTSAALHPPGWRGAAPAP